MQFQESQMTFEEANRRYVELKRQRDAGLIDDQEFDAQNRQLMVRDEEGNYWIKGRKNDQWYRHSENGWVADTPPGYPDPEPDPVSPAPDPKKPRRKWLLGAALTVVVLFGGLGVLGAFAWPENPGPEPLPPDPPPETQTASLPFVVGEPQADAERILESAGFEVATETRESADAEDGIVVDQSPAGYEQVDEGSSVTLTVGEASPNPPAEEPASPPAEELASRTVTDDSGAITVDVPADWSDVETTPWVNEALGAGELGAGLSAAPDLSEFSTSWDGAGVSVQASTTLVEEYDPEKLLDAYSYSNDCENNGREVYEDVKYTGLFDTWTNCGESGNSSLFVIAATPEDQSHIALVQIQLTGDFSSDEAVEVVELIQNSWDVVGELEAPANTA